MTPRQRKPPPAGGQVIPLEHGPAALAARISRAVARLSLSELRLVAYLAEALARAGASDPAA